MDTARGAPIPASEVEWVGTRFFIPSSLILVIFADSPQATERLQRLFLVSRVELVFLLLVVLDMALKPGS